MIHEQYGWLWHTVLWHTLLWHTLLCLCQTMDEVVDKDETIIRALAEGASQGGKVTLQVAPQEVCCLLGSHTTRLRDQTRHTLSQRVTTITPCHRMSQQSHPVTESHNNHTLSQNVTTITPCHRKSQPYILCISNWDSDFANKVLKRNVIEQSV